MSLETVCFVALLVNTLSDAGGLSPDSEHIKSLPRHLCLLFLVFIVVPV